MKKFDTFPSAEEREVLERLAVIIAPDDRLRIKAKAVDRVDSAVRQLMDRMTHMVLSEAAAGFASVQFGIDQRVIVVDGNETRASFTPLMMANPEIIWQSEDVDTCDEGCFSIPELAVTVTRPKQVKVRYRDEHDAIQERLFDNFIAKCIQHEIDHLDGRLTYDYVSPLKRDTILRKLQKLKKLS